MTKAIELGLAALLVTNMCAAADSKAPQMELTNRSLTVRLYLPDGKLGFYRGTRFDWSGVVGSLRYQGHEYYPPWFQRTDPNVHDFVYDGADIVAGPCTAITGPSEEFNTAGKALGFDEAQPGATFIKIGVGVLQRPDNAAYDPYRLYEIVDGGKWTVSPRSGAVDFRHELSHPSNGYGYDYRKTVALAQDKPELVLEHTLRNTGNRPLTTTVYNHNFLFLDRHAPDPKLSITVPFPIRADQSPDNGPVQIEGNRISFTKTLQGEDRVYLNLQGYGNQARDYDFRIEAGSVGAGLRITGDRPLSRVALWAIRAPMSIEPFIDMTIQPGQEFTWRIRYEYFTVPAISAPKP